MKFTLSELFKIAEKRGSEGPRVHAAIEAAYQRAAEDAGMDLAEFQRRYSATGRVVGTDSGAELEIKFKNRLTSSQD